MHSLEEESRRGNQIAHLERAKFNWVSREMSGFDICRLDCPLALRKSFILNYQLFNMLPVDFQVSGEVSFLRYATVSPLIVLTQRWKHSRIVENGDHFSSADEEGKKWVPLT